MKKFLSFLVVSMVAILPFTVNAATKIDFSCGEKDSAGNITCTVAYEITQSVEAMIVTLTEKGGANVVGVANVEDSEWDLNKTEVDNVTTVTLTSIGVTGEGDLFTFTYTPSTQEDCAIDIALDGVTKGKVTPDIPSEDKKTGATLPYVALGVIAMGATAAYLSTKNKSKMYKI